MEKLLNEFDGKIWDGLFAFQKQLEGKERVRDVKRQQVLRKLDRPLIHRRLVNSEQLSGRENRVSTYLCCSFVALIAQLI